MIYIYIYQYGAASEYESTLPREYKECLRTHWFYTPPTANASLSLELLQSASSLMLASQFYWIERECLVMHHK